jgi:general secretion pathway protein D
LVALALVASVCRAQETDAAATASPGQSSAADAVAEPAPDQEGPAVVSDQDESETDVDSADAAPDDASAAESEDEVPAGPPPMSDEGILLNFREAPLSAVLEYLSEYAGLVVLEQASVTGRVTVMSRQPLSVEEAVSLLNTVLADQGFAAVQTGRTLRIVALADAKRMSVPVRSGADPAGIEPNDVVITQVIPLKFADATQVRTDLESLISSTADFSANASSNALIMTDTGANVRRIVEIVQALDTHMAAIAEVRVFPLTYAEAQDAADLINEIFEVDERAQSGQRGRGGFGGPGRFFRGPGGEGGGDQQTESRAPDVVAAADERTNTLVVSGPSDTLDVVANVVSELDANPIEDESVMTYTLKNAQADNVAELLNDLFSQNDESTGAVRGGRTSQGGGRGGFASMMQRMSQSATAAVGGLSGEVYCVADEDSNTLLILTAPSNFDRLRTIIEDLDRDIPQVLIKVLIAEVTWGDKIDLGVEFSILNGYDEGDGCELITDFGLAAETGGFIWRCLNGDVGLILRALAEEDKLEILSRPHILTSDNQTAVITVGQEVPFIRDTRITETGQTINTIEYEDIGIILEVTPHINPDGLVIMDVLPEISTTTAETVPISETVDAAVFAKRSAQTRIAVLDDETIIIGGLVQDRKEERIAKVPLLGDIPIVGALFRRTEEDKDKTELLIFLTPHVAHKPKQLTGMREEEMTGIEQMDHAIAPGVFDDHMRGMELGALKSEDDAD